MSTACFLVWFLFGMGVGAAAVWIGSFCITSGRCERRHWRPYDE